MPSACTRKHLVPRAGPDCYDGRSGSFSHHAIEACARSAKEQKRRSRRPKRRAGHVAPSRKAAHAEGEQPHPHGAVRIRPMVGPSCL